MRGWLILANDHEPKSPIFSSKILSCLLSPSFEAEKSLGRITIRLKGEVDMKWWLFRVIGVERLLWRVRARTKQMTFQWQSKSIGFRLFGPTMTILFSRQSRAGKCKRRTKQMTFQWQSRASQTLMLATSWQGPDVHSNTFVSGRVLAVHWLCIGCALAVHWLCIGHFRENGCGWQAASAAPHRELSCNDYSIWPPKGKEHLCSSLYQDNWHKIKLTNPSWDEIGSKSWQVWICGA